MEPEEEYEILVDGNVEVVVIARATDARRQIAHFYHNRGNEDMMVRKVTRTYEYVYPEQL